MVYETKVNGYQYILKVNGEAVPAKGFTYRVEQPHVYDGNHKSVPWGPSECQLEVELDPWAHNELTRRLIRPSLIEFPGEFLTEQLGRLHALTELEVGKLRSDQGLTRLAEEFGRLCEAHRTGDYAQVSDRAAMIVLILSNLMVGREKSLPDAVRVKVDNLYQALWA